MSPMSLPLFDDDGDTPPLAKRLGPKLRSLADRGVYLGTSSWKYPGWIGQVYSHDNYLARGKFSRKKFDDECLREYAETFPVVGGDFSFYQFPTPAYWRRLFDGSPGSLSFGLKVPEDITVTRWPAHARYGKRAGQANDRFLDSGVFTEMFLKPLAPHSSRVAVMMFEFGTMAKRDFARPTDFIGRLGTFLGELPPGPRYSVEIRNPEYLGREYFDTLARHNAAHVFNAWTRMPEIGEQVEIEGAFTADFTVVRALLKQGRAYEDAVGMFEPYESTKEPNGPARDCMRRLIERALYRRNPAFLFVNNRLEGNAPATIEAVVEGLDG